MPSLNLHSFTISPNWRQITIVTDLDGFTPDALANLQLSTVFQNTSNQEVASETQTLSNVTPLPPTQ